MSTLASLLMETESVSLEEAHEYVSDLVESQLLISELGGNVTGPEPFAGLLELLRERQIPERSFRDLKEAHRALERLNAKKLGVARTCYLDVTRALEKVLPDLDQRKAFHVEMTRPTSLASLSRPTVKSIAKAVDVLYRLFGQQEFEDLKHFKDDFVRRFGDQEAPLLEVLDEEVGLSFPSRSIRSLDASSPLLEGVVFPSRLSAGTKQWTSVDKVLLHKVSEVNTQRGFAIELSANDIERMELETDPRSPDAVTAVVTLALPQDTSRGEELTVVVEKVVGPGAAFLGRFCHGYPALSEHVKSYLRAEERLQPGSLLAEIVHLPGGSVGNVVCRPVLRKYEIPFLGRSGAPSNHQIHPADLWVSVTNGRILLRSKRLGREVVPRLSSAHNPVHGLPLYRFLKILQFQSGSSTQWRWGPLEDAPFLPRVTFGNTVLCRARWRVSKDELEELSAREGASRFEAVQRWRADRRIPRLVTLVEGDNKLLSDLENILSLNSFVDAARKKGGALLEEFFPEANRLSVEGPQGRFVHEVIVPFTRTRQKEPKKESARRPRTLIRRQFPPGSEWLYAKVYTGSSISDQILQDVVAPTIQELQKNGLIDRWFFVRYADPDYHLRIRFHGEPKTIWREVAPILLERLLPLSGDARLWRIQFDTYQPEVSRYGGPAGIELAEQFFFIDSEAVLMLLAGLAGADSCNSRWRACAVGIDTLLEDFCFELTTKHALLLRHRKALAREFGFTEKNLGIQLKRRYQAERQTLEEMIRSPITTDISSAAGLESLHRRSERMLPIVLELQQCARSGRLSKSLPDLVVSFVHMHCNRLLRSEARKHELIVTDFLQRAYYSKLNQSG